MLIVFVGLASPAPGADFLDPVHPLHARLAQEIDEGRMSPADALVSGLRAVFEPETVEPRFAALASEPLRCATHLLRAADDPRWALDAMQVAAISSWRQQVAARRRSEMYLSAPGRFRIEYEPSGADSVDITDVDPANGVPDFVERVAEALETSWTRQSDELGLDPPDTGGAPYRVRLATIGSYGYTELDPEAPGGTVIVMRTSYEGLSPNDDPDGSALGSLRATAAHEFRHAGQYATSAWSEPGLWIEIDAVWSEEQVFPAVNDYVRYLQTSSPVSDPQLPLDNGGTPSYGESVLEFWMQRRLGMQGIRDYWERRRDHPAEHPIDSYDAVLGATYAPLDSAFVDFALHNLQCGSLAGPGAGYAEASIYPDTRFATEYAGLPATLGSTVEHLAAKFYRIEGFSGSDQDVRVRLRQPEGVVLRFAALTIRKDGVRIQEALPMAGTEATHRLSTSAMDIDQLYLVAANGQSAGSGAWFFADVEEVDPYTPPPVVALDDTWNSLTLAVGQTKDLSIGMTNDGPGTSVLEYSARAIDASVAARGIDNSTLSLDRLDYVAGSSIEYSVAILNAGTGLGYVNGLSVALPPGVQMIGGEDIVSEAGLVLTFAGIDGQTGAVRWLDLDGGIGAVVSGQTGVGKVVLQFDLARTGPAPLDWTLTGDGYGGGLQVVTGQTVLAGPIEPRLEMRCPYPMSPAFVGETVDILWLAADPAPVSIEISRDDGQSWETLVEATPNDGYHPWTATAPLTQLSRLRVRSNGMASAPSYAFPILQPLPWAQVLPASGSISGGGGVGLLLRVDATDLAPGVYPVRVDVRDAGHPATASLDVSVTVLASAVDAPEAARTRVFGVAPNPFNPATELRFELDTSQWVEVEVLDLKGRRVRILHSGVLDAGPQAAHWDGTDASGTAVASGTYLWRVRASGKQFTGKMSLVR
jgi:hypothetical protein